MTQLYNLSGYNSVTDFADFFRVTNHLVGDTFFSATMVLLFIILMYKFMQNWPIGYALRWACLICALISLPLRATSLISDYVLWSFVVLAALGIMMSFIIKD